MRAGASTLCLLWFVASAFAGYRLTARSFAWVDMPNFGNAAGPSAGASVKPGTPPSPSIDLDAFADRIPPEAMEQAKKLSPQQLLCLRAAVSPDHFQAAMQGRLTPQEEAAVKKCLQ